MSIYDAIIIGAGFSGAVVAHELADNGKRVLIIEKRNHIGGNAYDSLDDSNILVHKYGPHIFHTDDIDIFNYISKFTKWIEYEHSVVADVFGFKIQLPFNLNSIDKAFGKDATNIKQELINTFGLGNKVSVLTLCESENNVLSDVGNYVYKNIFEYYTKKQWGTNEVDKKTLERVPIFISYDDKYFQDKYQGIPKNGYTKMLENMLEHKLITILLNTNCKDKLSFLNGKAFLNNETFDGKIIYTGAIDDLFNHSFGHLPYRTLDFRFETHNMNYYQEHAVVNYTVDKSYTRITEFKHLTGQVIENKTTIVKEFPRKYNHESIDIAYYPIISKYNNKLYEKYVKLSKTYSNLILLGRLAEYKYYDMDDAIEKALKVSKQIIESW